MFWVNEHFSILKLDIKNCFCIVVWQIFAHCGRTALHRNCFLKIPSVDILTRHAVHYVYCERLMHFFIHFLKSLFKAHHKKASQKLRKIHFIKRAELNYFCFIIHAYLRGLEMNLFLNNHHSRRHPRVNFILLCVFCWVIFAYFTHLLVWDHFFLLLSCCVYRSKFLACDVKNCYLKGLFVNYIMLKRKFLKSSLLRFLQTFYTKN